MMMKLLLWPSEASVIRTAFIVDDETIKEIRPGYALIVRKSGQISEELVRPPFEKASCSFERIYFSRGNDRNIYKERKMLGQLLTPQLKTKFRAISRIQYSHIYPILQRHLFMVC